MKIYKAKKGKTIQILLVFTIVFPIIVYLIGQRIFSEKPFLLLPLLGPILFISWIYFGTKYKIVADKLIYRNGLLNDEIYISNIQSIKKGTDKGSGSKPALADEGLLITSKGSEEVFISPENPQQMIADLIKLNPHIQIIE